MTIVILTLQGRVRPGNQSAMERFLRQAKPYYESIGDVSMRFCWHQDDPAEFREEFTYFSERAYTLDTRRVQHDPEMQGWLERWRALLDGDVSVSVWREISID